MKFYPIAELTAEHQGKVVLINVAEFAHCKGQMGRPWTADEKDGVIGTDDPGALKIFFSHFMLLSEIEEEERAWYERRGWYPPTDAEQDYFANKYGRATSS